MSSLYKNVVVWDASRQSAEISDVVINGSVIESILPAGTAAGNGFDGKGKVAFLPGFVNAHGHAAMTLLRGLGEGLPLMEWLQIKIWPGENRLNGDIIKTGTKLALMEMLSTGTTCFADMYFSMDKVADASLEAGMRCGLSRGIVGDADGTRLKESLALARDYNGAEGLVTIQLGPHAPYTVPNELMTKVAQKAAEYNLSIQLHWLETQNDWANSGNEGVISPEDYLVETGLAEVSHLILAHCVYVKKENMDFYAKDNITIVHNPKSNLKLASGFAPINDFLKSGISVALGTDGAASNNRLDMWDEMRTAALVQKCVSGDPTVLTSAQVFKMATVAGAKALGFDDTGLIKEGFKADMMLVDLDKPHYVGWDLENLPGYLVYAGSSADVISTVVAGRTLYENGTFNTMDSDKIVFEAREARKYLTSK